MIISFLIRKTSQIITKVINMGKEKTILIKKDLMKRISAAAEGEILDRKTIKTPKGNIYVWASRDYSVPNEEGINNWYGLYASDLEGIENPEKDFLLFTSGDPNYFLLMPFKKFQEEVMPYLRATKDNGYFFLIDRDQDRCILPKYYIKKDIRSRIEGEGIPLDQYVNNLKPLGISSQDIKTEDKAPKKTAEQEPKDLNSMIRKIAEKDPTFLIRPTEEKLIIIRYHQLFG